MSWQPEVATLAYPPERVDLSCVAVWCSLLCIPLSHNFLFSFFLEFSVCYELMMWHQHKISAPRGVLATSTIWRSNYWKMMQKLDCRNWASWMTWSHKQEARRWRWQDTMSLGIKNGHNPKYQNLQLSVDARKKNITKAFNTLNPQQHDT